MWTLFLQNNSRIITIMLYNYAANYNSEFAFLCSWIYLNLQNYVAVFAAYNLLKLVSFMLCIPNPLAAVYPK